MEMTEALKGALPDHLTEVGALTIACFMGNDYERHQHERLSRKLGFGDAWVAEVERLDPGEAGSMSDAERAVQRLVLAAVERKGKGVHAELDAAIAAIGPDRAIAVLVPRRAVHHSRDHRERAWSSSPRSVHLRRGHQGVTGPLWITEQDVVSLMSLPQAISALRDGLREEAAGRAVNMIKTPRGLGWRFDAARHRRGVRGTGHRWDQDVGACGAWSDAAAPPD